MGDVEDAGPPTVTLLELGARRVRRRVVAGADWGAATYIRALSFSCDGRMLLILTGDPEWRLYFVSVEKARVLGSSSSLSAHSSPLHVVSGHPTEPLVALVVGEGVIRMLRLADALVRPIVVNLKTLDPRPFLSQCFLPEDRFVVGTAEGELLVFEGTEFKKILDTSPADGRPIDTLAPFSKGFVAGCDGGRLRVYEQSDDARHFYKLKAEFAIPDDESRFVHMAVSSSEEEVSVSTGSGQSYLFRLSGYELHKADDVVFAHTLAPFHGASPATGERNIVGMDSCLRKPYFVTAGADRTLRLWSHLQYLGSEVGVGPETHPDLVLAKRFSEDLYSVALHPTGSTLLIGFESSLQLASLLMEDVRPVKDFPIRKCTTVRFANGGHLFAAGNGAAIHVYESLTGAAVTTLRGHTDRVLSLSWSGDDRFLVSCGRDGLVVRWHVRSGRAAGQISYRDMSLTSVDARHSPAATNAVVCGTDLHASRRSSLRVISFPDTEPGSMAITSGKVGGGMAALSRRGESPSTVSAVDLGSTVLSSIAVLPSALGLIASTKTPYSQGSILLTPWPIEEGDDVSVAWETVVSHQGPVTSITCTPDSRAVVSGGADGSIHIYRPIMQKRKSTTAIATPSSSSTTSSGAAGGGGGGGGGSAGGATLGLLPPGSTLAVASVGAESMLAGTVSPDLAAALGDLPWGEEISVTQMSLEGSRQERERLRAAVAEITLQNNYTMMHRKLQNEEKMRDIEEKYKDEVDVERRRLEALREEKAAMKARFRREVENLQARQRKELEDLESSYKAKMAAENERFDALVGRRDERDAAWDRETEARALAHTERLRDLRERIESEIEREKERTAALAEEKKKIKVRVDDEAVFIEKEADREADRLRLRYERRLADEKQQTFELMGANTMLRESHKKLAAHSAEQQRRIHELKEEEKALRERISQLQKDVAGHKKEIRERDQTLSEKDLRVDDLRKKNQELEKFKFVLNYKIQELQRQIAPRQREIRDMRAQLKEMELELLQYHKSNAALDLMIGELRLRRQGVQGEVERAEFECEEKDAYLARVRAEIQTVVQDLDDYPRLRAQATALYRRHIHLDMSMGDVSRADDPEIVEDDFARQRSHLERSIASTMRKMSKVADSRGAEHRRLLRDNHELTREVNDLKRQVRFLEAALTAERAGIPVARVFEATGEDEGAADDSDEEGEEEKRGVEGGGRRGRGDDEEGKEGGGEGKEDGIGIGAAEERKRKREEEEKKKRGRKPIAKRTMARFGIRKAKPIDTKTAKEMGDVIAGRKPVRPPGSPMRGTKAKRVNRAALEREANMQAEAINKLRNMFVQLRERVVSDEAAHAALVTALGDTKADKVLRRAIPDAPLVGPRAFLTRPSSGRPGSARRPPSREVGSLLPGSAGSAGRRG